MLHFAFCIDCKFHKEWDSVWDKYFGKISKNKAIEMQLMKENILLGFSFDLDFKGKDHAGLDISLALLGYELNFNLYDSRHWDYENDKWCVYDEKEEGHPKNCLNM